MRKIVAAVILLIVSLGANAQIQSDKVMLMPDTLAPLHVAEPAYLPRTAIIPFVKRKDPNAFKATQLIAPLTLYAAGICINRFAHDTWDVAVRNQVQEWSGGDVMCFKVDDYLQYVPIVMDLGLGMTGISAKHCFGDRAIEAGLAYIFCAALSQGTKAIFVTERPNGIDNKSFPSGHTMTTFTAAELVRMEYGWGWGAGAYAIAVSVGFLRIWRDWHWMSDVIAGAGVGILCAHIGEWLLQPTKNLFHIPDIRWCDGTRTPITACPLAGVDPISGGCYGGLALKF